MKQILVLAAVVCSIFLFYSSSPGVSGWLYAKPAPDSAGINFVSIKKVKQIVTNDIIASRYDKKPGYEYLKAITWADWFFDVEDGKGFSKMNENLSSPDPNLVLNTILDIVYHLAEGIDESVSEFKKSVINGGFHNLNPAIDQATEYLAGVTDRERFSAFSPILEEALELKSKLDAYNVADKVKEFKQALDKVIENSFPENQNEQIEGGEIFKSFAKKEEEQKEGDWLL